MKNKFFSSFVAIMFVFVSANAIAQNSMANFSRSNIKAVVGENVAFTFVLDNIKDEATKNAFLSKFKSAKPSAATASTITAGKVTYVVTFPKGKGAKMMQDMLIAAGIENSSVDGKVMPTAQVLEYCKSMAHKNK